MMVGVIPSFPKNQQGWAGFAIDFSGGRVPPLSCCKEDQDIYHSSLDCSWIFRR